MTSQKTKESSDDRQKDPSKKTSDNQQDDQHFFLAPPWVGSIGGQGGTNWCHRQNPLNKAVQSGES